MSDQGGRWVLGAPSTAQSSSIPSSLLFSANSDTQGQSASSGASDLGAPRFAAPAVPGSSSGGRSVQDLLGPEANSYINSIM
eukprot:8156294-Heterocapsa_arctica.AAC.1